jgi:hypothetical protein
VNIISVISEKVFKQALIGFMAHSALESTAIKAFMPLKILHSGPADHWPSSLQPAGDNTELTATIFGRVFLKILHPWRIQASFSTCAKAIISRAVFKNKEKH